MKYQDLPRGVVPKVGDEFTPDNGHTWRPSYQAGQASDPLIRYRRPVKESHPADHGCNIYEIDNEP